MWSLKSNLQKQKSGKIFFSFLVSFLGLLFFLFFRFVLTFPPRFSFSNVSLFNTKAQTFFCLGTTAFLNANFVIGIIGSLLEKKKINPLTWEKWKIFLKRFLVLLFNSFSLLSVFFDYFFYSSVPGLGEKVFFFLIVLVINSCLLDLLVQLTNKYGICDSFNLFFFSELINVPLKWSSFLTTKNLFSLILLFFITFVLIIVPNLIWSNPVDTNTLLKKKESVFFSEKDFSFELKPNFSSVFVFYFQKVISFFFTIVLFFKCTSRLNLQGDSGFIMGFIKKVWWKIQCVKEARNSLIGSCFDKNVFQFVGRNFSDGKINNPFFIFFFLNDASSLFDKIIINNFFQSFNKIWTVVNIVFLLFFRGLIIFAQDRWMSFNIEEVSKDLCKRGIYFDNISPGNVTTKLLKIIRLKMFFFWFFFYTFSNVVFDVFVFPFFTMSFINWSSCVNVSQDICTQTVERIKYLRNS